MTTLPLFVFVNYWKASYVVRGGPWLDNRTSDIIELLLKKNMFNPLPEILFFLKCFWYDKFDKTYWNPKLKYRLNKKKKNLYSSFSFLFRSN